MDRKTYMKNIYSKYWTYARERKYGFLEYDKNLCNYICKNVSKEENILDVGIGTGFPFGDFFQKEGYNVHGVDIAPTLIEKCRKLNNKINCKVGDAENLEYPDNFFNCTYSFHSTFYFPNFVFFCNFWRNQDRETTFHVAKFKKSDTLFPRQHAEFRKLNRPLIDFRRLRCR